MIKLCPLEAALCVCLLLLSSAACFTQGEKMVSSPPNIIFIMSDDHAAQAISCYGSKINETPNLDRIADNGMRMDRVYCTNSICAPSRASILTGKFSHKNGVLNNVNSFDGSQENVAKIFQSNGYQTAMIGKWHLKSSPTGFDYWNVLPGQGLYYNPSFIEMGERKEYTGYVTDLITDFTLNWLDSLQEEKPFFLMMQHKAPHRNWMPNTPDLTLYDDRDIPEPNNLFDDYQNRSSAAKEQEMSIEKDLHLSYDLKVMGDFPGGKWQVNFMKERLKTMTEEQRSAWEAAYTPKNEAFLAANLAGEDLIRWKYQRYIKDYLRTIHSVDVNVGRLLDYLEENDMMENTVIIYTSDQGFYLGEHGWFDKRFMYEESYQMPFIIQYPEKIKAGSTSDALCMNVDFAPTMLELAGLPVPEEMQGTSFDQIVLNGNTPNNWRKTTYYHYFEYPGVHAVKRHYGVRNNRYKLIHFYYDIDEWELFDLQEDPAEMDNLYGKEGYEAITEELKAELKKQQDQYDDHPEDFNKLLERKQKDHLAKGKPIQLLKEPNNAYGQDPLSVLTDGQYWEYNLYSSIVYTGWLGYNDRDFEVVLDLGEIKNISSVLLNCYQNTDSRIYYPTEISLAVSDDGKNAQAIQTVKPLVTEEYKNGTKAFQLTKEKLNARYLHISAKRLAMVPKGQSGELKNAWLFVDEIIIE